MKTSSENKRINQDASKLRSQPAPVKSTPLVSKNKSKPRGVARARDGQKGDAHESAQVVIRQALPTDAEFAAKLLFAGLPHFTQYGIGMGKEERSKQILHNLFTQPKNRYSFEQIKIAEFQGKKAGLVIGLPGKTINQLNRRFFRKLIASYPLKLKLKLIQRFMPFFFIKEGGHDEYVISSLIIFQKYQDNLIGERLIKSVEKQARAEGYKQAVTLIEIQNTQMRKFFEEQRYKVKALVLESNKRTRFFGAGYQRLEKNL